MPRSANEGSHGCPRRHDSSVMRSLDSSRQWPPLALGLEHLLDRARSLSSASCGSAYHSRREMHCRPSHAQMLAQSQSPAKEPRHHPEATSRLSRIGHRAETDFCSVLLHCHSPCCSAFSSSAWPCVDRAGSQRLRHSRRRSRLRFHCYYCCYSFSSHCCPLSSCYLYCWRRSCSRDSLRRTRGCLAMMDCPCDPHPTLVYPREPYPSDCWCPSQMLPIVPLQGWRSSTLPARWVVRKLEPQH
mmetsp:Transcript_5132/g.13182  ORF Transcript_5132/g.13182 Transcript_5132/m.13182 type:complete len:243 (-) Transcript_5132:255-983(-)